MKALSEWSQTKTFFPLLIAQIENKPPGNACIVGASDGKFVLPLVEMGWNVTAIDNDQVALFGGEIKRPGEDSTYSIGLTGRLEESGLTDMAEILMLDMYDFDRKEQFDMVFTSCSWHYSKNHDRPVSRFINRMQDCLRTGGIFSAEYMMPVEPKHFGIEHYLYQGQIRQYFPGSEWLLLEEFYTAPFLERAHVGNLSDHIHQMGFLLAQKLLPPE